MSGNIRGQIGIIRDDGVEVFEPMARGDVPPGFKSMWELWNGGPQITLWAKEKAGGRWPVWWSYVVLPNPKG
jgi:hypothetical protein